jgi:MAF protein
MSDTPYLLLASLSPRRRQLISLLGLPARFAVADVDEDSITVPDPARNVIETARLKAVTIQVRDDDPQAVIVAADTTVAFQGEMLNKPGNAAEARAMLQRLRGRVHQVHTGLFVWHLGANEMIEDVATIDVPMRDYTDAEIEAYIATGDPMDKAGGYNIHHPTFRPVVELNGCYAGVMGFPLCHLARALWQLGLPAAPAVADRCQTFIRYQCKVYPDILPARRGPH